VSKSAPTISIRILDKEYQVGCPPEEADGLTASAKHLDAQMREIRDGGNVLGLDRMAVMAALNIAHDFLRLREDTADVSGRITALVERLSEALDEDV